MVRLSSGQSEKKLVNEHAITMKMDLDSVVGREGSSSFLGEEKIHFDLSEAVKRNDDTSEPLVAHVHNIRIRTDIDPPPEDGQVLAAQLEAESCPIIEHGFLGPPCAAVATRTKSNDSTHSQLCLLYSCAVDSLTANIVRWRNRDYITAGAVPYHSLWVRDAAHCTTALLRIGRKDIVRNHIELYFAYLKDNGVGPKGWDTINMESRVVRASARKIVGLSRKQIPFHPHRDLRAMYTDSRGSNAVDSNLLVLLSLLELSMVDGGVVLDKHLDKVEKMLAYYKDLTDSRGFIHQPAYSDWQDSQKRIGVTFLTNLFYHQVCSGLCEIGHPELSTIDNLDAFADLLKEMFYDNDTGLFRSVLDGPQVSIDGNLLALRWEFVDGDDASRLWSNLRESHLWRGTHDEHESPGCFTCVTGFGNSTKGCNDTGFPGFCTYPNYPPDGASYQVKVAGLGHYHDTQYWSWLMGLSGELCYQFGDTEEGDRIALKLAELAQRDGWIAEIFAHNIELPITDAFLFESERPFSWGSAYVIEMLRVRGSPRLAPE